MLFGLKKFISFWLMPLPLCVTVIVVGILLARSAKRARLGRALVVAGAILLILFSNKFVSRWLIRPLEARYPAVPEFTANAPLPANLAACRFVVVLGGGNGGSPHMSAINLLSSSAVARVAEAVRILRALPEAKLIVSGPRSASGESHATVLARAAQELGIAADRVIYIDNAHDTEDESRAVQRIAHGGKVALVTSAWHLPRAVALFRSAGLDPLPCPSDYRTHVHDDLNFDDFLWEVGALERSTLAIRERIGYFWIWVRGKAG